MAGAVAERYARNMNAFSAEELALVRAKTVCVVGCGGLGGYVAQSLARFGVGGLKPVDGDTFAESNLNRQLFADSRTLGQNKAQVCAGELQYINPDVAVTPIPEMLTEGNAAEILQGCDIAVDCLDNAEARILLDKACAQAGIPYVHGAIGGFYGQVSVVYPEDNTLAKIYGQNIGEGVEKELGNPPFIPQLVAAIQSSEAVKTLCGKGDILRGVLMYIDLLCNDVVMIDLQD